MVSHLKPTGEKPREPLRPWQADFAVWLTSQPITPRREEMLTAATGFATARAGRPVTITPKMLRRLREREDFGGLCCELEKGGLEAARAKYLSHLPELIDIRVWGARHAKETGDHRAVAALTEHAVEVAVPKKQPAIALEQVVRIELTEKQRESDAFVAPAIEVEILSQPDTEQQHYAAPANPMTPLREHLRDKEPELLPPPTREQPALPSEPELVDYDPRRHNATGLTL